jgi:hypothetical protein
MDFPCPINLKRIRYFRKKKFILKFDFVLRMNDGLLNTIPLRRNRGYLDRGREGVNPI